jgi:dTDP-4-dehydrorhamnose 3,5-epimerase
MTVSFSKETLPGVIVIEPVVYRDSRGGFLESFHQEKYSRGGVDVIFVQDNHSFSTKNTLRGLHYQLKNPQAKLIYAVTGEIYDVAVDIRRGSPHFGKWMGVVLSSENRKQIYVPKGFAHGFCVLSETADVIYKCSDFYSPGDEYGVLWSDPSIGIHWPVENPLLSEKDGKNPELNQIPEKHLPE